MKNRKYFKGNYGVGYITDEDNNYYFHYLGHMTHPIPDELKPASEEEIKQFEEREMIEETRRNELNKKEDELLAKYGLTRDMFVRFRNVYEEEYMDRTGLTVETRENGMGLVSEEARNVDNFVGSETDDYDTTYEYYYYEKLV